MRIFAYLRAKGGNRIANLGDDRLRVSEGPGVEFPTFQLTYFVVHKTLWHCRASMWFHLHFWDNNDDIANDTHTHTHTLCRISRSSLKHGSRKISAFVVVVLQICSSMCVPTIISVQTDLTKLSQKW